MSSENEGSSVDNTPEHTLVGPVDPSLLGQQPIIQQQQHRKLSQQNSLDKLTDLSSGGPQTIADLQYKLVQLTSQPSESLNIGTPPLSHPDTPHSYQLVGLIPSTLVKKIKVSKKIFKFLATFQIAVSLLKMVAEILMINDKTIHFFKIR